MQRLEIKSTMTRVAMTLVMMLTTATAWAADITQNTAVLINNNNKSTYHNKSIAGTVPNSSSAGNSGFFISKGAIVVDGIELNLTIDGFNVDYSEKYVTLSGISLVNGAKLHLTVKGTNTLIAGYGGAGIAVPFGCTLEITSASTGTLNATGGMYFGGGAGIGSMGNGHITQDTFLYPQGCGDIIINGGTINAQGGTWVLNVKPAGGAAGIGSSEFSGAETDITFGDNTYINNVTGTITINGGTVNAKGGNYAAGIGGGYSGTVKAITITGGNVTATAGDGGAAAIGTGDNGFISSEDKLTCPLIRIEHGTVQANGNIGFGNALNAACNTGNSYAFIGDADVTCTGSMNEPKIPESGNNETLTIPDGVRAFKVYDPAGKDGVYKTMNSDEINSLTLTAPTGYRLQLTGDAKAENAHFYVNDAASVWATEIVDVRDKTASVSVTSSGQSLCLILYPLGGFGGECYTFDINLMVTVFKPGETKTVSIQQTTGGTVTSDKTSAEYGETVTLTVTPNTGKFAEKVIYNDGIDHIVTRSDDGKFRFTMPVYDVTVRALFEEVNNLDFGTVTGLQSVYFYNGGNAIDISYDVETVGGTVLSKGTDYDAVIRNSNNVVVASVSALGTYTLTVTGKGNYTGSLTKTFVVQEGLRGSGAENTPYLISSTDEWNFFANTVNSAQSSYTNQYVKLTNNIDNVTVAAGTSDHPFCGTFIGDGYTMDLKIRNGQAEGLAPFSYISGATIKDLTVAGSVFGRTHSAGLVGFTNGTNTIDGCKVNVRVEVNNVGNQHVGGVVGHGKNSTLTIKNTSFGGHLVNHGDYAGGLMGWCDAGCKLTIDNCLTTGICETTEANVFHPIAIRNENAEVTAINRGAYYTSQPTQTNPSRIIMRGTRVYADQPSNEMYRHQVLADGNSYYVPVTISGIETVYAYTGSTINPTYTVTAGDGTTLTEGTDYSVTRSNATIRDAGAYAITFTGKNGYEGAKTCYFMVGDPTPATPSGLSVDADIDYPEVGHFYYNMPAGKSVSNTLTFSNSDVTTFKVYDGGGKNDNIPLEYTNSSLTISAPTGCTISVKGDVKLYNDNESNYVSVYNVSGDSETELAKVTGYNTLGPVSSTSNTLRIYYYQGGPGYFFYGNKPGYDLTVTINDANKKYAVNVVTPATGSLSTSPTKAAPGSTVTITATPAEGYLNGEFTVLDYSQQPVAVSNGQFVMPSSPVIVATTFWQIDPADFSVNGDDTYTIKTVAGWYAFCDCLQENATYNRFIGKTVKLDKDITVTRMAGSDNHDICGTFDGCGHTITLDGNTSNGCYALFRNAVGATIKNLHVDGTIVTAGKYAAGLISGKWGDVTIENCRSSVTIKSSVGGDGTHAGFVAVNNNGKLNIKGCVFDGKLLTTGTTVTAYCGGFVGWRNSGDLNITDCLYTPADIESGETEISGEYTFARNGVTSISNSYYTRLLGTAQGLGYSFDTAPANIGTAGTAYSVSGITPYTHGIAYDNRYYMTPEALTFVDNADNDVAAIDGYFATVTLQGRTLYQDGDWNTLCLPFDVSTTSGLLAGDGVVAMTLNTASSGLSGTTLTLNFTKATTIPAGTPFIIKWGEQEGKTGYLGTIIENPVFTGVTIDNTDRSVTSSDGYVTFKGTYDRLEWNEESQSILFVGAGNTLYWPQPNGDQTPYLNAFRAYFQLNNGLTAAEVSAARMNFDGENEVNGVKEVIASLGVNDDSWYTLNGVKLSGKPTKAGLYIHNGKKVIIK